MFLYDIFSVISMRKFTQEDLDNMTMEDFHKTTMELQKEINQSYEEIFKQIAVAEDFPKFKKVFTKTFALYFRKNMEIGLRNLYFNKRLDIIEEYHNNLVTIILDESKKNNNISEDTKKKLNKLEEEIKKNKKLRSLFGDVSISLFKSSITGVDVGD